MSKQKYGQYSVSYSYSTASYCTVLYCTVLYCLLRDKLYLSVAISHTDYITYRLYFFISSSIDLNQTLLQNQLLSLRSEYSTNTGLGHVHYSVHHIQYKKPEIFFSTFKAQR